jgi:ankyrin repeat protein
MSSATADASFEAE